jgi:hypothetical protein
VSFLPAFLVAAIRRGCERPQIHARPSFRTARGRTRSTAPVHRHAVGESPAIDAWQCVPLQQTVPHSPQLPSSFVTSTHARPQHTPVIHPRGPASVGTAHREPSTDVTQSAGRHDVKPGPLLRKSAPQT